MSQKLSVDGFEWKKILLSLMKAFQKTMMKIVIRGILFK